MLALFWCDFSANSRYLITAVSLDLSSNTLKGQAFPLELFTLTKLGISPISFALKFVFPPTIRMHPTVALYLPGNQFIGSLRSGIESLTDLGK
jgi:hypothetical protein